MAMTFKRAFRQTEFSTHARMRRGRSGLVVMATLMGFMSPAIQAQRPSVPALKWDDTTAAVMAAAEALGSLRFTNFGGAGSAQAVKALLFVASGSMAEPRPAPPWPEHKVTRVTGEISYYPFRQGVARSPGIRWDFEAAGVDGQNMHQVHSAAADLGWDQSELSGSATSVNDGIAAERMRQIWLTPHGLMWAATSKDGRKAADGVHVDKKSGETVLTIPVAGTPVVVTLNADNRPKHVETRIKHPVLGDIAWEADYSDYKDFEQAYEVYFPAHIVQKLGGRTVLDLTVTDVHSNPYVVFPLPPNVAPLDAK